MLFRSRLGHIEVKEMFIEVRYCGEIIAIFPLRLESCDKENYDESKDEVKEVDTCSETGVV